MICEKCGRRYEDDMPKCLWCDAPNQKYDSSSKGTNTTQPPETKVVSKNEHVSKKTVEKKHSSPDPTIRESATPVFWYCFLLGSCGLHCFKSGKRKKGILYLLFGGLIYGLAYLAFSENGAIFPSWFAVAGLVSACFVKVLVIKDQWKISLGKYRSRRTGRRYRAKAWMIPLALVATILTGLAIYFSAIFLNDNVLKKGRQIAAKMELEVEAYMIAQQNYFDKNGKIGNFEDIGFKSVHSLSQYYSFESAETGLRVVYEGNMNCLHNSTWTVEPSVANKTLIWKITLPENSSCNAMASQMAALAKNMQKQAESATASAEKLDEGVDGVGVVPDSTQH